MPAPRSLLGLSGLVCTSLLAGLALEPLPGQRASALPPLPPRAKAAVPARAPVELERASPALPEPRAAVEPALPFGPQPRTPAPDLDALFELPAVVVADPAALRAALEASGDERLARLRFRLECEITRLREGPAEVEGTGLLLQEQALRDQQLASIAEVVAARADFGRWLRGPYSAEGDVDEDYERRYARAASEDLAVHQARVHARRLATERAAFDLLFAAGKYRVVPESALET